ncbi:glycosyltransferase [Pontibacter vulgaris]|uniref:glycosyltransferase n=1 Tax=Pontibacter vulgaris TaxID=2905679 RepID=UPI001FA6E3C8|nr:glycosyltransferase [Pontibacter vulgaris]
MKICFFPGTLALGGIGKVFINLIEEYASRGILVDVFLVKREGEFLNQLPSNVRLFEGNGRALNSIFKFIKYIKKEKPDAVVSAREYLNIINILGCTLSFSKTKAVVSLHTDLTAENKETDGKTLYKSDLFITLARILYKLPTKVIAVSERVADDFSWRMNITRNKIKVIYNPVYKPTFSDFIPSSLNPAVVSCLTKRFIVAVGRLTQAKDFANLINAFKLVSQNQDVSLLILGEGQLRKELEALIKRLSLEKSVFLLGYIESPSYFIKRASVLVVSSKYEGFGNVIVEALGVGTPIVSTNCPGGPSEILENGKYGKLVPVGNSEMLSSAILETLNAKHDADFLINRAKDFAVSKIADQYLSYIYD